MQIPRIDPKNAAGLIDKLVGLGKEIVGSLTSNDRLSEAGQVQQEKGTERLKAIKAQTEAEGHQAKAKTAEQRQKSTQNVKEAAN